MHDLTGFVTMRLRRPENDFCFQALPWVAVLAAHLRKEKLEPIYRIVTFQLASDAPPARVTRLLERLERLVQDVNRSASLWGASA